MVTKLEIKRNANQITDVSRIFVMRSMLITNITGGADIFGGGVRDVS